MKCIIIINEKLPIGLMANTAAVLSLSIGDINLGFIGGDVLDKSGSIHKGITSIPIPILSATNTKIKEIRNKVEDGNKVELVDFTNVAQQSHSYEDYTKKMSQTSKEEFEYLGVGIWGDYQNVTKLIGNLPLLK